MTQQNQISFTQRGAPAVYPKRRSVTRPVDLDDVLITSQLSKRGQREEQHALAASALHELAMQIENGPADLLARFVELARKHCEAGSAGISICEPQPDGPVLFRWNSLTGRAARYSGRITPRDFSPFRLCLDRAEPILLDRPGRHYDWLNIPGLPIVEALLVPLFVAGQKPFGTLWLMSHDDKRFDRGDALMMGEMATLLRVSLSMMSDIAGKNDAPTLADAALRQSSKMAALGRLTGDIAHDFNNLLTVLSGQLQYIQDHVKDERLKQRAESGIKAAHRAEKLVQQILSFARRTSPGVDVIDVEAVITEIVDMLRQMTSSLSVTTRIADDVWPLRADQDQLMLAIFNIAINARDAMPEGGTLSVDVRNAVLRNGPDDNGLSGDFIAIAVSDTGAGMSPDTLTHAFEAFFTTKGLHAGTGLGLSMVAGFAKQLGGTARIVSELCQGTTVTLYLPRATAGPAS